jgi:hypothetical protein
MNQALYAHMNNKRKMKKKKENVSVTRLYLLRIQEIKREKYFLPASPC